MHQFIDNLLLTTGKFSNLGIILHRFILFCSIEQLTALNNKKLTLLGVRSKLAYLLITSSARY